jgi:cell division protein FtsL
MKSANGIDLLVQRAEEDAKLRRAPADRRIEQERRYVFNGDPQRSVAGYAVRTNRRAVRRRRSTFSLILILFAAGAAIVLYISNILAVNRLAHEVNGLQTRYDKLVQANQVLKAEIDRKSALDRVGGIATEQLGLRFARTPPEALEVDEERVRELTE